MTTLEILPPLHPPRLPSYCNLHPGQPFTGFCAPCLSDRLSSLPSTLRRSKSFSVSRPAVPAAVEPQRRSCDVRSRSTLSSLFHQADKDRVKLTSSTAGGGIAAPVFEDESSTAAAGIAAPGIVAPVFEDEPDDGEIKECRISEPMPIADASATPIDEAELKTMKEHITDAKKPTPGSFWLAASVFSKKLQTWRRKQKLKKSSNNGATQSEIAVDGFGRRSCDIDPRFSLSLDAGRMSVDDPRFSWDAPRASWDGHLIGGRSMFARFPPMLAVGEGEDCSGPMAERWDARIPVEEEFTVPGGDYYVDSSSGRRRSLDRPDSELKPVPNGNVSPSFHLHNVIKRDRDDRSESFESAFRDSQKGAAKKKTRRWGKAWNIWGFIYRRGGSRAGNEVERTFSESWRGEISRSNSNVSMRSSSMGTNSGFGSTRRGSLETNWHGKKRRGEIVLERNRSARYSPGRIDNGMLRFYLTPIRGSRRMSGKSRHNTSYSNTKTMLGMY